MKQEEFDILQRYFPSNALAMVAEAYASRNFRLVFKSSRVTKLGDFRPSTRQGSAACITLNVGMNPYQTLITYIHELAHYDVHILYGRRAKPHGDEWKRTFATLMQPYLTCDIFPPDILERLRKHLKNPFASSGVDAELSRLLRNYDNDKNNGLVTVEDIPMNAVFRLRNGLILRKGKLLRKYYLCTTIDGQREYRVAAVAECFPVDDHYNATKNSDQNLK